jgi:hypothetical protein
VGLLSPILRNTADNGLVWWCPGCDKAHRVQPGAGSGPRWTWNGNAEKPTFSPSVLVTYDLWTPPVTPENLEQWRAQPWPQHQAQHVCHSFVVDGNMQFLGDCTHALAGKTVPIPPWPRPNWSDG